MNKELELIFTKIQNKEPFSLIRFGDGEKNILDNIPCKRKGFSYNPGDIIDRKFQKELIESLHYNGGKNYFVGVNDKKMEKEVKGTLISPMIFVNENYLPFLRRLEYVTKIMPVILIVNKTSKLTKIPFSFVGIFGLDDNAWRTANNLDIEILNCLKMFTEPCLFLIAGGAYSCSLIHKLWKQNKNHIYIDIGSTLDPYLYGQNTRQYQERLKHHDNQSL